MGHGPLHPLFVAGLAASVAKINASGIPSFSNAEGGDEDSQPVACTWDDGSDPVQELEKLLQVPCSIICTRLPWTGPTIFCNPAPLLAPLCDIPSGCCSFTGPWTVTRSSLRMFRRVATFCRPLRPVLLLVSFPRSRSPVVGVLGLC